MSNIRVEDLAKEIEKYLNNYKEDIQEDVENVANEVSKEAVVELKQTSPKNQGTRKNKYYLGWTATKDRKSKNRFTIKIHNKTNYQLTHLLEFGHATRNGGRTKAIPHIRPAEEKFSKLYEERLKRAIERSGK